MNKIISALIISILISSCQKAKQDRVVAQNQNLINTQVEKKYDLPALAELSADAQNLIDRNQLFIDYSTRLEMLKDGSKTQFLDQGDVLTRDVRLLRDSTSVDVLNQPGSQARINGLYTLSLRLKDMNTTPEAFSQDEVYQEVLLMIRMYNSLVERINSIALKNKWEEAVLNGATGIESKE